MTRGRRVPPPADIFSSRFSRDDDEPGTDAPQSTPPTPTTSATGSTTSTSAAVSTRGAVSRRSFYMWGTTEARLKTLIDDVHFATRVPKVDVLDAIVAVAEAHAAEVWRKVGGSSPPGTAG